MKSEYLMSFLTAGLWDVRRTTFDFESRSESVFTGKAEFRRTLLHFIYTEIGITNNKNIMQQVIQRFIYEPHDTHLLVRYEDGRHFYSIDCRQLPHAIFNYQSADIHCTGSLLIAEDKWQTKWIQTGPHTNLEITTLYESSFSKKSI